MDNPTISFSNIPFASYTAIVYGYSDEERTSIIAMGQESITVAAGETTSATIYISPVADIEGEDLNGTVEIFLSFAEDMQIDKIRLVDLEGNVLATQTVTLDSSKSVTFRQEVDAGLNQRLYLEFYCGGEYVGESVDEIYNIYSGQVAHSTQNDLSENDPYQNLFFDEARNLSYFEINELEELNKLSATFSVPAYEFDEIELSITGGNATERTSLTYSELKKEGYVVETASDHDSAIDKLAVYSYDCVLLDIMLPGGSGLDILEYVRRLSKRTNVIIISAKDSIDDKVRGLELGADDYLAKPFHLAELVARMRSVSRRSHNDGEFAYRLGNVSLEPDSNRLRVDGKDVPLLKKEFDILAYLMQRPGHLVDKTVLAEAVWGDHVDQADNFQFVYAQMKNLRRKLEEAGADIGIKSVYGFGYKLTEGKE